MARLKPVKFNRFKRKPRPVEVEAAQNKKNSSRIIPASKRIGEYRGDITRSEINDAVASFLRRGGAIRRLSPESVPIRDRVPCQDSDAYERVVWM